MYQSTEDARSDLLLSAAVYVFGRAVVRIVLGTVPLTRVPLLADILAIVVPLALTVLVPFLLIRYRREPWARFGFGGSARTLLPGALLAVPVVVASLVAIAALGGDLRAGAPVVAAWTLPGAAAADAVGRLALWVGLALLGVYVAVKARDAFRGTPLTLRGGVVEVGRIVVAAAAVAGLLLLFAARGPGLAGLSLLLPPLGLAASLGLVLRGLRGPAATTRPVLVTPTVIFALGPFLLSFDALSFVNTIYQSALFGGAGLLVAALVESRRSVWPPLAFAAMVGAFSLYGGFGGLIR